MGMLPWFIEMNGLCRAIRQKTQDALKALAEGNEAHLRQLQDYLKIDADSLAKQWPHGVQARLGELQKHIHFNPQVDYEDILRFDLPDIERKLEHYTLVKYKEPAQLGFEALLHRDVANASLDHYRARDFRNAVLDGVIAVFDKLRRRIGSTADGERLINDALSLQNPRLILTTLADDSGRSDQIGFMQIFKGVYGGIRNPKAHTLDHTLDELSAAQYLVLASALARRIDEAKVP
jgi:uncharacterized protein (TIGR02391 family)